MARQFWDKPKFIKPSHIKQSAPEKRSIDEACCRKIKSVRQASKQVCPEKDNVFFVPGSFTRSLFHCRILNLKDGIGLEYKKVSVVLT